MFWIGTYRRKLARKISLWFGAAVLATITGTLTFPWIQMGLLDKEALLLRALWIATIVRQSVDLSVQDWTDARAELTRRWPRWVRELGLPAETPQLVPLGPVGDGFRREALEQLSRNTDQRHYWRMQDNGRRFRFALAIRGTPAEVHPNALRGLVDVQLPVSQTTAAWNVVVTLLAGASGAVLAILVFYMVTQRHVLNPVMTLKRVAEQVTQGDLEVRAHIGSGDEFQELAEAVNRMLTHLRAAQDELRTTNRSLDVRLGELAETNVALFESNRLKSEFLTNVTHELRTPLVSIIGFAELLRDSWDHPDIDRARLKRYSENILSSGRGLLEIINDLLDLAKIEAGRLELHVAEFSITDLATDLLDFVRPLADKKNHRLACHRSDDLPPMRSDSGKIKQILYNLLSNAIKFTPPEGAISLTLEHTGDGGVRLTVSDSGPGIPDEHLPTVFEKFRQLDASKTREHEGTGLGLAITRELVQMLGGFIRVDSKLGSGTTFIVELPLAIEPRTIRPRVRLT